MKTLDEVIKAFEWCNNEDENLDDCTGCPYNTGQGTDCHERNVDALYYLKEYQEKQKILNIRMAEYNRGFEQLGEEWARIKNNPPLTDKGEQHGNLERH